MNQKIDTTEPIQSYRNSIIEENRKPGSTDWQLTRVRLDHQNGYRSPWIEGVLFTTKRRCWSATEDYGFDWSAKPI